MLAALSPAYFKAWSRFLTFYNLKGIHPLETSGQEIVSWLNHEPCSSKSLRVLKNYLNIVKSIRHAVSKPITDIPIQNYTGANSLSLLELEPETIQDLIHKAIYEYGPDSFVGIRQATLYTVLFCSIKTFTSQEFKV